MPGKPPVKPGDPPIRPIDYTINDDGCWVWNWSVHPKGYATVQVNGRARKAHRVAYELANGPIPDGQIIRHLCGNPSCINPEHLQAGTITENSRDMVAAGNQVIQKLMLDDAAEIRRIFAEDGISRGEIARKYDVTPSTIGYIIANKTFHDPAYIAPPIRKQQPRGTVLDNIDESSAKEIRRIYLAGGTSQQELADTFKVYPEVISRIVHNKLYPEANYIPSARKASNQKLTKAQADEIREKAASGVTRKQLAEEYGVTPDNIRAIISGKTHHGSPRQYSKMTQERRKSRPTLQSVNGPAPTSKAEQQRRQEGLLLPGRKPRRKSGQPIITENDWTLEPETGCHNWRWGEHERQAVASGNGKIVPVHRLSWEIHNGQIPQGYQINHHCNNARCINPEHLYLGDQFENMQDTVRAGNHATQKLTWSYARAIRAEYEPGRITWQEIADKYGVASGTVGNIINNKTYFDRHYTPPNPGMSVLRKLTMADANAIREKYKSERITLNALAREFGVSRSIITGVVRNETYYDPAYTPPSSEETRQWKLSNNDVAAILSEYKSSRVTYRSLATKYGVTPSHISEVIQKNGGAPKQASTKRPSHSGSRVERQQLTLF